MAILDTVAAWGWAIALGIQAVFGALIWAMRQGFASRGWVERLEADLRESRSHQQSLAATEDIARIERMIAVMAGDNRVTATRVEHLTERYDASAASLKRIEDYLLNNKA